MLNSSTKDLDQTTADSLASFFGTRSSLCRSTRQQQYAPFKETKSAEEHYFDVKQSESQFHKQDSFSTLSIGQSHYEASAVERAKSYMQNIARQSGKTRNKIDIIS